MSVVLMNFNLVNFLFARGDGTRRRRLAAVVASLALMEHDWWYTLHATTTRRQSYNQLCTHN